MGNGKIEGLDPCGWIENSTNFGRGQRNRGGVDECLEILFSVFRVRLISTAADFVGTVHKWSQWCGIGQRNWPRPKDWGCHRGGRSSLQIGPKRCELWAGSLRERSVRFGQESAT